MLNKTDYNEGAYKTSDNIDTASNKSIAVFSPDPEVEKNLSRLNKAVVIKHDMLDTMPAVINEHDEIEILASFNPSGNDIAIYCNDKLLSDFMSAFIRMHGESAYCNPLDNPFIKEDFGKKLIHIDIPSIHKNNLTMFIDGMASFLNGNLYLFNKRLYAGRKEWEHDIDLMLRSKLSNIKAMFKTISPEGMNSAVNSTLAKVDPRHMNYALSIAKNVVGDIKEGAEIAGKKAKMEIIKEKKLLKAEKTSIQKQTSLTEKALRELEQERDFVENSKAGLVSKMQKLKGRRLEIDDQKHELEKALAEFKGIKAKHREEQKELNKTLDAVKSERRDVESGMLRLQGLNEELEREKKELLGKKSEAEKTAMKLEEEKSWIDGERLRLEEMLSKEEEKAVAARKAELESLRGKIELKKKIKTKALRKRNVKTKYKATKKRRLKPKIVKVPIRVKTKKVKKNYKGIPRAAETKPMLAESVLEPNVQSIGFYKLKSKLDRYEPVHKRKRLGAWVLEKKRT